MIEAEKFWNTNVVSGHSVPHKMEFENLRFVFSSKGHTFPD